MTRSISFNQDRPAKARDAQRLATRAAIVDAAIQRFAAHGFEGATLQMVAQDCGQRVPLILYHFESKLQLWRIAVDAVYARYEGAVAATMPLADVPKDHGWFRAALHAQLAALTAHPEYLRILFQEGTVDSERLRWMVERHQSRVSAMMATLIGEAQAAGLFVAMDPMHAKFLLSGASSLAIVMAPEYRLVTGNDPQSPAFLDAHVDALMAIFMRGEAR